MKGQVRIEFIFGIVLFAVIMFYMSTQLNNVFLTVGTDSHLDTLKQRSVGLLRFLLEDEDGFVSEPYLIDNDKLDCDKIDLYHNGTYRLKLYNEDGLVLSCGYAGVTQIRSQIMKYVQIDGGYGNVTLEMW